MPSTPTQIARSLTAAQRKALHPFVVFSDKVGRGLIALGLLQCNDGVWTHTKLGTAVFRTYQPKPPRRRKPAVRDALAREGAES